MKFRNLFQQALISFSIIGSMFLSASPVDSVFASQFSESPSDAALTQLASLTPEEKVGQLFLITFNGADTDPASPIFDLIANYHIGGIVLARDNDNFQNPESMPGSVQSQAKCHLVPLGTLLLLNRLVRRLAVNYRH